MCTKWSSSGCQSELLCGVTDWLTADADNPAKLTAVESDGELGVTFGFNPAATNYAAWVVLRSLDVATDPFVEIFRYDGPTGVTTTNIPVSVTMTNNRIEVLDLSDPPPTNAYYRLEIDMSP